MSARLVVSLRTASGQSAGLTGVGPSFSSASAVPFAQNAVDLGNQRVGAAERLFGAAYRGLGLGQLLVQLGAPGGDVLGFAFAFGGRRTQRLDLGAQRANAGGIDGLRGQEPVRARSTISARSSCNAWSEASPAAVASSARTATLSQAS